VSRLGRLSLRARLVLGVLVLGAVGLVAADVATYTSLRSFLLDRVDRTLDSEHQGAERAGPGEFDGHGTPTDYVQVRSQTGRVLFSSGVPHFPGTEAPSPPRLPATIEIPAQRSASSPDRVTYFTVPAESGGGRYRVRASIDPDSSNVLVIATSLSGVDGTLHRLLLIELFASLAVLLGIAVLGLWIVRLGLRPLAAIEATASRIAGGDLSHRVERADDHTEVGRVGSALNYMLDRIEASDRRLRRFVADASHELRTPLAAVRAYAELFERGADRRPADLARAMSGISRESERMSELVEDLLLLARLDEGQPLEREPVALAELAAEAVDTARALEPDRPIDLETEEACVLGDRARLRRVLDNLLGNVRSHTPAGTPAHVRVTAANGNAVIEVADEGPGLPPGAEENLFRRFYRADASRSRDSGGVGLGLSIVAAIAQAHVGTASASAGTPGGALFRVTLPLLDSEVTEGRDGCAHRLDSIRPVPPGPTIG
jgi:two-component system OmpR family sensor kinase